MEGSGLARVGQQRLEIIEGTVASLASRLCEGEDYMKKLGSRLGQNCGELWIAGWLLILRGFYFSL